MSDTALLTPAEAADRLGVSTSTLVYWRTRHTGPKFVRIGGSDRGLVRYRPVDLDAYITASVVEPSRA